MKKICLTLGLFAMVATMFAQHPFEGPNRNVNVQSRTYDPNRATTGVFIDYPAHDEFVLGTSEGGLLWINSRNQVYFGTSTLGMSDAYAVYDSMIVTTDYQSYLYYPDNSIQNFMLDTIYLYLAHQNNSGTEDTIIVHVKNVQANGTPGSTILFSDTTFTSTDLTGPFNGSGYPVGVLPIPTGGLNIANGKFSLHIRYQGAAVDTFGLISSNATTGIPCSGNPTVNEVITTAVFPSSFYRYWNSTTLSGVVPDQTGAGGLYIDCDGDGPGGLPGDWPTEQAVQTWNLWVYGELTENLGLDEEEAGVSVNAYPNPATDFTTIEFTLQNDANVSISMTDISGKVVYSNNLGHRTAGKSNVVVNTSELSNGVYMYTIVVDSKKVTRRIIVNK